ncbi:MAG: cation acetate symporter, partial [Planctomycetia bacterium]|nr:cation acetate symporter [Planctomycetia bacterium]
MIYEASTLAVVIFVIIVGVTLALSFYLGSRARSAQGYFAAGGQIHWFVNGIAFAGDYLSAASFLGICGMIAFYGYDGFLYSIGYLAGWVVALFVIAEPLKRLGRYTFADALDSRFNSRGIKLSAAISTLVVSVFYLIPQMVGAGALVKPLLGFSHATGVLLVGTIVTLIVVTAGMVSTTYVQFIKGSLLVIFSTILTAMILIRGFSVPDSSQSRWIKPSRFYDGPRITAVRSDHRQVFGTGSFVRLPEIDGWNDRPYIRVRDTTTGELRTWRTGSSGESQVVGWEVQTLTVTPDGKKLINGLLQQASLPRRDFEPVGHVSKLPDGRTHTGPLGPLEFLSTLQQSEVILWEKDKDSVKEADGS